MRIIQQLQSIIRLPLRLIPRTAIVPILSGPLKGTRWIVGSGNHGCWIGTYEREKLQMFSRLVREGDVVFDLGANTGIYSLLAARLAGARGHVLAIEPNRSNVFYLKDHLRLNRVGNCEALEAAVADHDGEMEFEQGPNRYMGRLAKSKTTGGIPVKTISIDSYVSAGGRMPNVIKCDIEGGEDLALEGARRTLIDAKPILFIATHGPDVRARCLKILSQMNYKVSVLNESTGSDELLARPSDLG